MQELHSSSTNNVLQHISIPFHPFSNRAKIHIPHPLSNPPPSPPPNKHPSRTPYTQYERKYGTYPDLHSAPPKTQNRGSAKTQTPQFQ